MTRVALSSFDVEMIRARAAETGQDVNKLTVDAARMVLDGKPIEYAFIDPAEIPRLEAERAAEIKAAKDAEERIRFSDDRFRFASGRIFKPDLGFIGITNGLHPCDGRGMGLGWNLPVYEHDPHSLSSEDMAELADIMIDRWERFKASLEGKVISLIVPAKMSFAEEENLKTAVSY